jgi:hypothetical protein
MKQSKFKPIMISFDEEGYKADTIKAKQKLEILDEASVWICNTLDIDKKVNLQRLHTNMLEYFKDAVLLVFHKQNTLGLSADKLIEAKEYNVKELVEIQNRYEANNMPVSFSKKYLPSCKVERRTFEKYTKNERQNSKLIAGNKVISALNDLEKITPLAKMFCSRLTNGYILYNLRKNKYFVNNEVLNV